MRGDISNAVADTALEADYRIDQGASMQRQAESTTRRVESWLLAAENGGQAPSPPAEVLEDLALAPESMFARVEEWLGAADRWKQVIALSAYVRRLYAPKKSSAHRSELVEGRWIDRSRYRRQAGPRGGVQARRGRRRCAQSGGRCRDRRNARDRARCARQARRDDRQT